MAVDACLWAAALIGALWLRLDFEMSPTLTFIQQPAVWLFVLLTVVLQSVIGVGRGLYTGRFVPRSASEASATAIVFGCTTVVVFVAAQVMYLATVELEVPRSVILLAGPLALVTSLGLRMAVRDVGLFGAGGNPTATPVVVFGAGSGGRLLVRQLTESATAPYRAVAILDDDPQKRKMRIHGVEVAGTRADLDAVAERYGASTVVIAVPTLEPEDVRDIRDRAEKSGYHVLILPPIDKVMKGKQAVTELRGIDVHDLLGRQPVRLDLSAIAATLKGKRVLITGAGGSIGSELCRQVAVFDPAELIMLDRDESALHSVQLSIEGKSMLDGDNTVLIDIRDRCGMIELFNRRRPDVVFHAAALKHLPLLESYPLEALKSNVLGTYNVLEAARVSGVDVVVNVSTDKAANPICTLGESKRVAERITAHFASASEPTKYVSVRFGNVLGSRGSVLTVFERQIAEGGPLTVTDPEVSRFFMTIPEACQLVLQAAVTGDSGETVVLDMGEPLKISEVARTLIERSEKEIEIVYTGLREGEKMAEELFDDAEQPVHGDRHPLLSEVRVEPIIPDLALLEGLYDHHTAQVWMARNTATGAGRDLSVLLSASEGLRTSS